MLQHRYDVQGNRTETQMPDGRTLRYLYYGSGHLQQINPGVMSSASSRATTCTVRCSGARAAGHAADVRPDGSVNAETDL
ncbi:hypothetical protein JS565_05265 [Salmonella enterica subsp. enterica serovar Senftenberg]|nr:hypothetical protein [Salmonella enterica subsp. enterica serovar Senftenberg]